MLTDPWYQLIEETVADKDWEDIDGEVKQEINEYVDKYRPRFEEEFEQKDVPKHPYKIMMEIRKANDLYGGQTHDNPELIRALKILKDEYEEEWKGLANGH